MTRELLNEALGWKNIHIVHTKLDMVVADTEENFSDPDWDEDWEYGINIYELAHKCKEWAKGKGFQILSGVDNANTYRADVYYTDFLITDFEAIENTEPEAIFKACEWILEHKEIKL